MAKRRHDSTRTKGDALSRASSSSDDEEAEEVLVPLSTANILPLYMVARRDFKNQCKLPPWELSELTPSHLATLRESYNISNYIEMAPAGTNYANVYRPGYCTFHEYAFQIGYSLLLYPLAEELYRLYGGCPAQITPCALKVCRILTTYAVKAEKEVTVHHLLQMFGVRFMIGSML